MSKFKYIYSNKNNLNNVSYILDSNILITLKHLYLGQLDLQNFNDTMDMLYKISPYDVIPGVAIAELTYNFEHSYRNVELEKEYLNIANYTLNYPQLHLGYLNAKTENSKKKRAKTNFQKKKFSSLNKNKNLNDHLIPTFCILKKFSLLLAQKKSNKQIYEDIIDFIISDLKMSLGLELILIQYCLLSKHGYKAFSEIFKIKDKYNLPDNNIYNASWDIFFLRLILLTTSLNKNNETLFDIKNPCLITSDEGLYNFYNSLDIKYIDHYNGEKFPGISISLDTIKPDYHNIILKCEDKLKETKTDRINFLKELPDSISYFSSLLEKLYNESEK